MTQLKINLDALLSQTKDGNQGEVTAKEEKATFDHKAKMEKTLLDRVIAENKARIDLSDAIFTVTVIWMAAILLVVYLCGCGSMRLSDTVLVALITTTTANVFGFLYVVVNYLFNKDKST